MFTVPEDISCVFVAISAFPPFMHMKSNPPGKRTIPNITVHAVIKAFRDFPWFDFWPPSNGTTCPLMSIVLTQLISINPGFPNPLGLLCVTDNITGEPAAIATFPFTRTSCETTALWFSVLALSFLIFFVIVIGTFTFVCPIYAN